MTIWEFLSKILATRQAVIIISGLTLLVLSSLSGVGYLAYEAAEPGTEVSILGVVKITKAKRKVPSAITPPPLTRSERPTTVTPVTTETTATNEPTGISAIDRPATANPTVLEKSQPLPGPRGEAEKIDTEAVVTPPAVRPPTFGHKTLVLKVREDSWLEVRPSNGTGPPLWARLTLAGTTKEFHINEPVRLVVGNPRAVTATLDGRELHLPPVEGKTISRIIVE